MNVLVTGSNGQIGSWIRLVSCQHPEHKYVFADVEPLTPARQARLRRIGEVYSGIRPVVDTVVLPGALISYALSDDAASRSKLEKLFPDKTIDCIICCIEDSLDVIFDGNRIHYAAELIYSEFGTNFCKTILRTSNNPGVMKVPDYICGYPVYARDIAVSIFKELSEWKDSCKQDELTVKISSGCCSRYEFASAVVEFANEIHSMPGVSKAGVFQDTPLGFSHYRETKVLPLKRAETRLEKCDAEIVSNVLKSKVSDLSKNKASNLSENKVSDLSKNKVFNLSDNGADWRLSLRDCLLNMAEFTPSHWYIGCTKSCAEKKLLEQLDKRGVQTFLPTRLEFHKWSDRIKKVQAPLISRVVFFRTDENTRRAMLEQVPYLIYTMTDKNTSKPAVVPDDQIHTLRLMCDNQLPDLTFSQFQLGDKVRVKSGPLKDQIGIVSRLDGRRVLGINIEPLGFISISLQDTDFEIIND